jgi:protein phosphatase
MNSAQYPARWSDGHAFGLSDKGVVRRANEDNFLIDEALGLLVVADGMGGHADGALASAQAIEALREHLVGSANIIPGVGTAVSPHLDPDETWPSATMPALSTMFDAIDAANRRVYGLNAERGVEPGTGMGTTLVGLWHNPATGNVLCFHVGDSRLYRWRRGVLEQITHDHSAWQAAVDAGEVDNLPPRNMLMRAIGPHAQVTPDVRLLPTQGGDVFLLCSDGVHGVVPEQVIGDVMAQSSLGELDACCAALLQLAVDHGSADNATVILARRDLLADIPVIPV